MNVLVCGCCMPEQFEYEVKDLAAASNQYHLNMIKAIESFASVKVLSYIGMNLNGIPKEKIEMECNKHRIECIFKEEGIYNAYKIFQQRLSEEIEWADIVITYNIQYVWFGVGKLARKHNKKAVLVWADHTPISDRESFSSKMYGYLSEKNARQYQKVVALSPNMKKYLDEKQDYYVSHGCVNNKQFATFTLPEISEPLTFMFSGLLAGVTGADIYLEAIKMVTAQNVRFIITGKGMVDVRSAAQQDDRIDYRGFVPRDEYLSLMQSANIMVNPRNMNLLENKNNFPSKMLEYLASGRVILSTRFPGYEKFDGCCTFVDSNPEAIAQGIEVLIDQYENIKETVFSRNRQLATHFSWREEIKRIV